MDIIGSDQIENGLQQTGRVYLCGDLHMPNSVEHISTDGYEIGISLYREYTFEKAHIHRFNAEYNYVLSGSIKIFLLAEKREYVFSAGDLFVIHPNEPYVGKALPGTRTLFSKDPGGDDKELVPMSDALLAWGSAWSAVYKDEV